MATAFWPRPTRRVYRVCRQRTPTVKYLTPLSTAQCCNLQLLHASPSSVKTRCRVESFTDSGRCRARRPGDTSERKAHGRPGRRCSRLRGPHYEVAEGLNAPALGARLPLVEVARRLHLFERTCLAVYDHVAEPKQPLAEWAAVGCDIARALEQRQTRLTKVEHVRLHQLPNPWLP